MKKVFALMLICFMALGVKAALADTRTDALGLQAGTQVDDLDSIWMFPQAAGSFGNVVDFRLGAPSYNYGPDDTSADWGGIIHKDWDEIGYIGIYYNRPFNDTYSNRANINAANMNGIFNGRFNWDSAVSPYRSSYNTMVSGNNTAYLGSPDNSFFEGGVHYQQIAAEDLNGFSNFGGRLLTHVVEDPNNKLDLFWSKDYSDITLGAHFNYASSTQAFNGGFEEYGTLTGNGNYNSTLNNGLDQLYTAKTAGDTSVLGLDLGLTLKNLGSNMSLDLGLGYSLASVNYQSVYTENYITAGTQTTFINDSVKDNNISELRVNALLKNKVNDTTNARLFATARLDNLGFTNKQNIDGDFDGTFGNVAGEVYSATETYTDTNFNLGMVCDHSVAEGKAKVIAGLSLIYDGRKWSQTGAVNGPTATPDQLLPGSGSTYNEDWWVVPFNTAIEAPLFDWLTARMGAQVNLFNNVTAKVVQLTDANVAGTAYQTTTTYSNTWDQHPYVDLSYGMSAKFNNLTIDMQLDPTSLLNNANVFEPGAGILYGSTGNNNSGNTGLGDMFGAIIQADARYAF